MGFFKKATAVVMAAVFTLGCAATALAASESPKTAEWVRAEGVTATDGGTYDTRRTGNAYLEKADKTATKVKVNTAKVDGQKKYGVTRIMGGAFKNTAAQKVWIGKNVKKIYTNAFKGGSVNTLVFNSGNYKYTLQSGAFNGVKKIKIKNLGYSGAKKLIKRIGNSGYTGKIWVYGLSSKQVSKIKKGAKKLGYSCKIVGK